jgi:ATP-dependent Clp protease ATP-binding subunit ClpB
VDFRNTVIIMTSNIGSAHILEWSEKVARSGQTDGAGWDQVAERVKAELRIHFRPEFLNRVDDIVVFRPLSREDLGQIVDLQLDHLRRLLAGRKIALEVSPDAKRLVADLGYDPVYGARPLKRVIQSRLQNPIALELLEGRFAEGDTIRVEAQNGSLAFTSGRVAG